MKNISFRCAASATLRGNDLAPGLCGTVRLSDTPYGTRVIADVCGLPQSDTGFFGIHIHTAGCCDAPDFACAGGHFNPGGTPHPLHAGDMPMLLSTDMGCAHLVFTTTRFRVCDVVGRAVIIHGGRDDYTSQPGGDAGPRIACGIIHRS